MDENGQADEIALLRRFVAGDVDAFTALVAKYYSPLVRFATRLTGSKEAAEDVLQDVWLRIWRVRDSLSSDASIRPYVFAATRRACINARRANAREERALGHIATTMTESLRDDRLDVLVEVMQDEMATALQRAVATLPDRCRETWLLSREQGLSYAEIATVLGVSTNTVKTQMARAMTVLRRVAAAYLTLLIAARL